MHDIHLFFFFQAEDGIRDYKVTGVQTCALPILAGMALACFGLASTAKADPKGSPCGCLSDADCGGTNRCYRSACVPKWCDTSVNACCCHCQGPGSGAVTALPQCASLYLTCFSICGAQLCHK